MKQVIQRFDFSFYLYKNRYKSELDFKMKNVNL